MAREASTLHTLKNEKYMKNRIALCLPAILDHELIAKTAQTVKDHIIKENSDVFFDVFVNIDNHRRFDGVGTVDSIEKLYKSLETENCKVTVSKPDKRMGLNKAYKLLAEQFEKSESSHCVFFDDDHFIINPVNMSEIISLLQNKVMIHLGCGKKEQDKSFSYENPFLVNEITYKSENLVVYANNRNFYTLPGTFLSKDQIRIILSKINFASSTMVEKLIPDEIYNDYKLETAFFNAPGIEFKSKPWVIDLKYHFAHDALRANSGHNGVDLRDYNP